ncbi:MAG: folate-binding protein YgfZ [Gammaproteobacteria bacterium]
MSPEWKIFLENAGALIEHGSAVHFGKATDELHAIAARTLVCDLSYRGIISATGADAQSFLQGQFTNDVRAADERHSQLNAYCSPKGRALAVFRLWQRADTYYLSLPKEILEATLKRLRMFVLRAQVVLADASDHLIAIGLAGPDAELILSKLAGELPQAVDACVQINFAGADISIVRVPGAQARFEIYGEVDAMKTLWNELADDVTPVGAGVWKLLDIRNGIPTIYSATVDAFVPQMINLHEINGVSFKKGCYPGQEIVARMQYLGTLKRRMYKAHVHSETMPLPGGELYTADHDQSVGQIVDAQPAPQGGIELLAVLQIASAEEGKVRLHSRQGPVLHLAAP